MKEFTKGFKFYESVYQINQGNKVLFRPVKFTDERMLQELNYSLSEEDRILRFFAPRKSFSHKQVQPGVAVDYEEVMGIIAHKTGVFSGSVQV